MLRNRLAENWKHSVFLGCQNSGFQGSRPDIENPAFQNSCSNQNWYWKPEKKIHFKPKKGHFLVYFNRASANFWFTTFSAVASLETIFFFLWCKIYLNGQVGNLKIVCTLLMQNVIYFFLSVMINVYHEYWRPTGLSWM